MLLENHIGPISDAAFSSDGSLIALAHKDCIGIYTTSTCLLQQCISLDGVRKLAWFDDTILYAIHIYPHRRCIASILKAAPLFILLLTISAAVY